MEHETSRHTTGRATGSGSAACESAGDDPVSFCCRMRAVRFDRRFLHGQLDRAVRILPNEEGVAAKVCSHENREHSVGLRSHDGVDAQQACIELIGFPARSEGLRRMEAS